MKRFRKCTRRVFCFSGSGENRNRVYFVGMKEILWCVAKYDCQLNNCKMLVQLQRRFRTKTNRRQPRRLLQRLPPRKKKIGEWRKIVRRAIGRARGYLRECWCSTEERAPRKRVSAGGARPNSRLCNSSNSMRLKEVRP